MTPASDDEELIHRSARSEIVRVPNSAGAGSRVLKIVPREAATPERIADLRREFERTSSLEGKNLVACLGLECRDDVWAMHLEDIGGRSLESRLGEPLDRETFFAIAIGLAEALTSLHARGVLHLRVCPSHVVYADAERALRLIDFSCAVPFSAAFADRDLGAHDDPWTAPELRGHVPALVDARTDLYGLGATLHGLVHGVAPGDARPERPHASDYLSPALLDVIDSLVEDDTTRRPADADSVRRLLVAHRDGTVDPLVQRVRRPPDPRIRAVLEDAGLDRPVFHLLEGDTPEAEQLLLALVTGAARQGFAVVGLRGDADQEGRAFAERTWLLPGPKPKPSVLVVEEPGWPDGPVDRLLERLSRTHVALPLSVVVWGRSAAELAHLERLARRSTIVRHRVPDAPAPDAGPEGLSPEARELAELASLVDEPASIAAIAGARSVSSADVRRAVRELAAAGLVLPSATAELVALRFRTRAQRTAFERSLSDARRADLHLRLARAMDPGSRAHHDTRETLALALHLAGGASRIATETERRLLLDVLIEAVGRAVVDDDLARAVRLGRALAASVQEDDAPRMGPRLAAPLLSASEAAIEIAALDVADELLALASRVARRSTERGRVHGLAMRVCLARSDIEGAIVELDASQRILGTRGPILAGEGLSAAATHAAAAVARAVAPALGRGMATGEDALALDILREALLARRLLPRRIVRAAASRAIWIGRESGAHPVLPFALVILAREIGRLRPRDARALFALALELLRPEEDPVVARRVEVACLLDGEGQGSSEARAKRLLRLSEEAEADRDDAGATEALVAAFLLLFDGSVPVDRLRRVLRTGGRSLPASPRLALLGQLSDNLAGVGRSHPSEFRGPAFEDGEVVEALRSRDHDTAAFVFATRAVLSSLFDRSDEAVRFRDANAIARAHDEGLERVLGLSFHAALSALDADRSPIETATLVADYLLDSRLESGKARARRTLLAAEVSARLGADERATKLFDEAARTAAYEGRLLDAARAHERAARYHGRRGEQAPYEAALRAARKAYAELGHTAKLEELDREHPWLVASTER
ncbi:MAG: hypothetical protein U0230_02645 [Polyangiales bacterium]